MNLKLPNRTCIVPIDMLYFLKEESIKHLYLYFDLILYNKDLFEKTKKNFYSNYRRKEELPAIFGEFDFLESQNIIKGYSFSDIDGLISDAKKSGVEIEIDPEIFTKFKTGMLQSFLTLVGLKDEVGSIEKEDNSKILADVAIVERKMINHLSRMISLFLSAIYKKEIVPIIDRFEPYKGVKTKKESVTNIILKQFPIIDTSVPWSEIIEFRKNTDSYNKFLALRNWIIEICNSKFTPNEIEEKLTYLLIEYENYLKINKIKYRTGNFEIIVNTSLEVIENLLKLKLSKISEKIFEIRNREIQLLEMEQKAVGREVAYIYKVKKEFK